MMHGVDVLGRAIDAALDDLLAALDLRPCGVDCFVVEPTSSGRPDRVFGGQLLAQAVVGACGTVADKDIHSLHASFLREPDIVAIPAPDVAPPEKTPLFQALVGEAASGRHWIEQPPALELRLHELPSFLTGVSADTARSFWMRLPRSVGADHSLNAALLAYASDFFLMDMLFRLHPHELGPGLANGFSLDHAIWFHRPVRFDAWHLHTQEAITLVGDRGLARGEIHTSDGGCVASVAQEVLIRLSST